MKTTSYVPWVVLAAIALMGATTGYVVGDGTLAANQVLVGSGTGIAGGSANLTYISGQLQCIAPTAGTIPMVIKGAASQTSNLTSWVNSAGSTLAFVSSAGAITTSSDFMPATTATFTTGFTTSNITDSGERSQGSITVMPSNGLAVFAYVQSGSFVTETCADAACTTVTSVTQDTGLGTDYQVGGALASDGFPIFSYQKSSGLTVAHCTGMTCASTQKTAAIASGGSDIGRVSTLVTTGSTVALFYTDHTASQTKYARCDNPTAATPCSTIGVGPAVVRAATATYMWSAITPADGFPLVMQTDAAIKCTAADCGAVTVTGLSFGPKLVGLAIDPVDGFGTMAAEDSQTAYAMHCTNASCSTHTGFGTLTVAPSAFFGPFINLVVPASGNPIVVTGYGTGSGAPGLRMFACSTNNCSSSSSTTITSSSIATLGSGLPAGIFMAINNVGDVVGSFGTSPNSDQWTFDLLISSVVTVGTMAGSTGTRFADGWFGGRITTGALVVDGTAGGQGSATLSGLTASLPVFTNASKTLVSNPVTGTGSVVMSASPTLTGTLSGAAATFSGLVTAGTGIVPVTGGQTQTKAAKSHTCTLDGGATATCTATVTAASVCACSSNGSFGIGGVTCSVSSTTLTATSTLTLDTSTVSAICLE